MKKEPKSVLNRYAFGFSNDKKAAQRELLITVAVIVGITIILFLTGCKAP